MYSKFRQSISNSNFRLMNIYSQIVNWLLVLFTHFVYGSNYLYKSLYLRGKLVFFFLVMAFLNLDFTRISHRNFSNISIYRVMFSQLSGLSLSWLRLTELLNKNVPSLQQRSLPPLIKLTCIRLATCTCSNRPVSKKKVVYLLLSRPSIAKNILDPYIGRGKNAPFKGL